MPPWPPAAVAVPALRPPRKGQGPECLQQGWDGSHGMTSERHRLPIIHSLPVTHHTQHATPTACTQHATCDIHYMLHPHHTTCIMHYSQHRKCQYNILHTTGDTTHYTQHYIPHTVHATCTPHRALQNQCQGGASAPLSPWALYPVPPATDAPAGRAPRDRAYTEVVAGAGAGTG